LVSAVAAVRDGHGDRADAGDRRCEQGKLGPFGGREDVPGHRRTLGQHCVQRAQRERGAGQPGGGLQRPVPAAGADPVAHELGRGSQPRYRDGRPPAGEQPAPGLQCPVIGPSPLRPPPLDSALLGPALLGGYRHHAGHRDPGARAVQRPVHADQGDRVRGVAEHVGGGQGEQARQQHRTGPQPPYRQRRHRTRDGHRGQGQARCPQQAGHCRRSPGGEAERQRPGDGVRNLEHDERDHRRHDGHRA
jgi:hypothetical protein